MHLDSRKRSAPASLAAFVAGAAVFMCMMARVLFFYNTPDETLIGAVPDDAFYYMQMARHRVVDGFWTFDGTSPATGFHFLYAHLLVALYWIFGLLDWRQIFLVIGAGAALFMGMAAYFVSRTAEILFGRKAILLAVAPFFGPVALTQSTSMMESWLVLFFSAATLYALVKDENPPLREGVVLLILGFLGSLSRTDYGMLPGVLFLTFWISSPLVKDQRLRRSAYVLAGAVLGVAVVLLQNLCISGHLSQASAQTKFYWSSVMGHSASAATSMVISVALPFFSGWSGPLKIAALLSAAPLCAYGWRRFAPEHRRQHYPAMVMTLGCCLTLAGYIVFYRHNSQALRLWYAAHFIAPLGVILAAMGFLLLRSRTFIPAVLAFCLYALTGAAGIFAAPWPYQAGLRRAGLFLKEQKSQAVCASWNAGIISYFSGAAVINLDGITNDEVLPFIKHNALFDYIQLRNIRCLLDYEEMLRNEALRRRGGYLDARMDRCMRPLQTVDGDSLPWSGSRVRWFEVIRDCH